MDVLMPQLGETVAEGKITKWFKAAGDAVKPGDNLFEIETDKTSMEVPATSAGTLTDIRFQVGEIAKVGAVVAVIAGDGRARQTPRSAADAAQCAAADSAHARESGRPSGAARAGSPLARGRADRGVASPIRHGPVPRGAHARAQFRPGQDCERRAASRRWRGGWPASAASIFRAFSGSGPHGRIVAARRRASAQPARAAARGGGASAAQVKALFEGVAYEEVPLDGMRRTIATRLIEAKQTIPHFYLTADIEIGRLIAMREEANAAAPKGKDGEPAFKLSLNDFIIKAWAAALQRVPAANAVWAEDRILRFQHADIGVAVALDGGLITPVVRNAEAKSLTAISAEMRDLAARARDKKLKPNEYQGGAQRHLQSRHVRRARVLRDHQSAARHHPRGRRRAPRAGRDRGRRRQIRQPDDGDALLRPPRGRRRARRRTAGGVQGADRERRSLSSSKWSVKMAGEKPDVLLSANKKPVIVEGLDPKVDAARIWPMPRTRTPFSSRVADKMRAIAIAYTANKLDAAFMQQLPKLEQISSFGVGYDHIDAKWAGEHGIVVTNTPEVLNEEVADTALGLLLCTVRELPQAERYLRAGKWPQGALSAHQGDAAQPHRRHGRHGPHRQGDRAPARSLRRAGRLSLAQSAEPA